MPPAMMYLVSRTFACPPARPTTSGKVSRLPHPLLVQGCANILEHTCLSSNGQSGSAMWDSSLGIRAILTGKVCAFRCVMHAHAPAADLTALKPLQYAGDVQEGMVLALYWSGPRRACAKTRRGSLNEGCCALSKDDACSSRHACDYPALVPLPHSVSTSGMLLPRQVSTSDNQDINVATKIDSFVYNTIAQWYNEDAQVPAVLPPLASLFS